MDAAFLSKFSVTGSQTTRCATGDDSVSNLGNRVNMQGVDAFGFGVGFEAAGVGKDGIQSTVFTLRSSGGALDLDDLSGVDLGVRHNSVGNLGGAREGSLKLFGSLLDTVAQPPMISRPPNGRRATSPRSNCRPPDCCRNYEHSRIAKASRQPPAKPVVRRRDVNAVASSATGSESLEHARVDPPVTRPPLLGLSPGQVRLDGI